MLRLGRFKNAVHAAIGMHRRRAPLKMLHKVTAFIESAYANEGSDFATNGEKVLLHKLSSSDMRIALDVGANVGDWSVEALRAWPNCEVHGFEVAPKTFQELSERIRHLPASKRMVLNDLGCSDADGSQTMYYFPDHPDLTCDLPRHTHESIKFDAKMVTLDRYCRDKNIGQVDFLKMDVEGAEYRVLKGFSEHLRSKRVDCIQFEYGAFSTQTRFLLGDYYSMLSDDFWIGKIYPGYVDFRDYDWTMEDFRFSNYCCVSKAKPALKKLLAS
jgi:FkbM family methyltransferase